MVYIRVLGVIRSYEHKLNWLSVIVFVVLSSMIVLLVALNWTVEAENGLDGLECIYNCESYSEMMESMK